MKIQVNCPEIDKTLIIGTDRPVNAVTNYSQLYVSDLTEAIIKTGKVTITVEIL